MPHKSTQKSAARHLARNAGEITLLDADIGAITRAHALQHGKRLAVSTVIVAAAARGKINQKAHSLFPGGVVQQAQDRRRCGYSAVQYAHGSYVIYSIYANVTSNVKKTNSQKRNFAESPCVSWSQFFAHGVSLAASGSFSSRHRKLYCV